ncbi:TrmB family transcriptional regulator [Halalkalicoccus tibetensis]|uniref:TrmB family transcriptional regulator n=1 Tax=Halalkalicoccus tibetensis TaxID=175632 RepID=A0ABD5V866_9EURY
MSQATLTQEAAATTPTTAAIDSLLAELDSSNAKLVYLYLATVEEASIDDLQTALEIQQLTLFPTLRTLEDEDLIERNGETITVAA